MPHDALLRIPVTGYRGTLGQAAIAEREGRAVGGGVLLGQDEKEPVVLYNVACFYAMKGDPDRSLELLERAVENGWGDLAWLQTDSDLDSLRDDDRFKAILKRID